jgi:hypothetical protein
LTSSPSVSSVRPERRSMSGFDQVRRMSLRSVSSPKCIMWR